MRQTRGGDDFIGGIGVEVQPGNIQADLPRDWPDMDLIQRRREGFIIQPVCQTPKLMEFCNFPQYNCRNTLLRVCGEDVSFACGETSFERFDQNVSVQIQHPKQLQSKTDRPLDSRQGLS